MWCVWHKKYTLGPWIYFNFFLLPSKYCSEEGGDFLFTEGEVGGGEVAGDFCSLNHVDLAHNFLNLLFVDVIFSGLLIGPTP